eukprot:1151159-Pelagomonas_calceolata.AAC.2
MEVLAHFRPTAPTPCKLLQQSGGEGLISLEPAGLRFLSTQTDIAPRLRGASGFQCAGKLTSRRVQQCAHI